MLVRQTAELETNVVAVERLKEYSEVETEVIILKNMYTKRVVCLYFKFANAYIKDKTIYSLCFSKLIRLLFSQHD